ncbi:DUF4031 domain-containing protein [Jonesiaceae bacterium BS-20]|uniref:DUF4031 domain-containing protein n=1 Tax=Jonesiaceae bacterium BS-20 TaxID=3120821 RepID=A0AAU7DTS4_9MICO
MAIYIDPPLWPAHGTVWSHLVSDTSYAELHVFAARAGFPRRSFDLDHYDVPQSQYELAISHGALPVSTRIVVHQLRGSGLRIKQANREAMRPVVQMQYLHEQWARLHSLLAGGPRNQDLADPATWQGLGDRLLECWSEPHRKYHTVGHLEDVLLALNLLEIRGETIAPVTLLAAWFHDVIYNGDAGTDETASADLAINSLLAMGVSPGLCQQVGDFIVATTPGSTGALVPTPLAHLLDSDLAIFGASPQRYDRYTLAVRTEYAHVPDADFRSGRAKILRSYLDRPVIYRTQCAQDLWEQRARMNLATEIQALEAISDTSVLSLP